MLKIVSYTICPFVQRVTGLLEAKGIEYQVDYISLSDKPQWFLDISPNGQVPLLITDNGTALFESEAIIEYIDETSAPLESNLTPEQRALDRAYSYMGAKQYLPQCSTMRSSNREQYEEKVANLRKALAKAEAAINGPFFKGEQLSNVDIAWLPLLHRAAIIEKHSGTDMLEGFTKVKVWQQAILNTGICERSVSSDFEKRFTTFYLSDKTYLGGAGECSPTAPNRCSITCC